MSGNRAAGIATVALLLAGCADQPAQPDATAALPPPGSCGVEGLVPDGSTLTAGDLAGVRGATSSRWTVLARSTCAGGVAREPDRCERFPWATEMNLYALGGRGWLDVGLGSAVREQVVIFAVGSSFAETYVRAAQGCGFTTLTVVNGDPATLERSRGATTEIVYMTARSVIWMSSTDPAVGLADLVRLAGVAEERSAQLTPPA
ncbi:hypothetical protein [Actinoplanes sp. L3-i22]|uniref:hypothetical protein n=1 Tax=Actinoplanes sp. L3-i22 TaxID=2836373 RepID=UPI001C78C1D3|nr:hypothetical protein [Actinoplanes sp. L3-i22]BCY12158.1 hypothetical protein L3i22_072460 [Actinoplanes sp. L3-i22]